MSEYKYNLKPQAKDKRDLKAEVVKKIAIPSSVDLRDKCPPVWGQGDLGSCTAHAGIAAFIMWGVANGLMKTPDEMMFSRLYLYYKERELEGNIGEDSGATMRSICKALQKYGVCDEKLWKYIIKNFAVTPSVEADLDAAKHKINAYKALKSVDQIKQYIALNLLPAIMGIAIYDSFESNEVSKTGIVPMPDTKTESQLGGHAIEIVGYKDTESLSKNKNLLSKLLGKSSSKGYFICRNSWLSSWGDKGYFYLPYEFWDKKIAYDAWHFM